MILIALVAAASVSVLVYDFLYLLNVHLAPSAFQACQVHYISCLCYFLFPVRVENQFLSLIKVC